MENTGGGDYWRAIQDRQMVLKFRNGDPTAIEHSTEFLDFGYLALAIERQTSLAKKCRQKQIQRTNTFR
jgi:hypothetical protein